MLWVQRLWLRLQTLFSRRRVAERSDDEIQFHLDQQTSEYVAAGMDWEEARRAAMRSFGNRTLLNERTMETWGWGTLDQLGQDLRYGFRGMCRNAGSTLFAILIAVSRSFGKPAQWILAGIVCTAIPGALAQSSRDVREPAGDWAYYGRDAGGTRYSPLAQINRDNVATLKVAWTFHVGDISDGSGHQKRSGLETTPILIDGTLYLTTAFNRVFALDPETGKQRWVYDPMVEIAGDYGDGLINRGVSAWLDPARAKGKPCRRRIFETTLDARLIALDGVTGEPCRDFGNHGQVSLRDVARYVLGQYHMTSPPAVIDDVVVVGSAIDRSEE